VKKAIMYHIRITIAPTQEKLQHHTIRTKKKTTTTPTSNRTLRTRYKFKKRTHPILPNNI
jgi:hypothetical protein